MVRQTFGIMTRAMSPVRHVRTYFVLAEVREMAGKVVGIFRPLLPPVIRKSGG
jgi:hypothetical protein